MEFIVPTPEQGIYGLRAMKTIALADGALDTSELAMLRAGQELSGAVCDLDALEIIEPAALASALTNIGADDQLRWQMVQAMVLMATVDQEAEKSEVALIERFAEALGVDSFTVGTLRKLAKGHNRLVRFDILRRFWAVDKVRERIKERGLRELWAVLQALRGKHEDEEMAARYRALGELPEGTLGRTYYESMRADGFPLPGEPGSAPEAITYHDMTHVLGGYGTTSDEEILVACFSAGYRGKNPMAFVLFVLCQFHLGLQTAPGQVPTERGRFDPATALAAIRRGAAMNVDLSQGWEYWDVVEMPIDEVRARYNIAPRA